MLDLSSKKDIGFYYKRDAGENNEILSMVRWGYFMLHVNLGADAIRQLTEQLYEYREMIKQSMTGGRQFLELKKKDHKFSKRIDEFNVTLSGLLFSSVVKQEVMDAFEALCDKENGYKLTKVFEKYHKIFFFYYQQIPLLCVMNNTFLNYIEAEESVFEMTDFHGALADASQEIESDIEDLMSKKSVHHDFERYRKKHNSSGSHDFSQGSDTVSYMKNGV